MTDSDQLCDDCAPVPLYSLFTGPRFGDDVRFGEDGVEHVQYTAIGTLYQVWTNVNCPLCRMVKHCILGQGLDFFERVSAVCDPSEIQV